MTTSNERLKKARIAAGFETAKAAADRFGWKIETYRHHENGTGGREVSKRLAPDYAKKFKVRVDWLLYGQGEMKVAAKQEDIPIYGKAGARERVNLIESDDHEPIDTVTPLRAEDGYHAVIVEGSSMLPAYRDGDMAIVNPRLPFMRDKVHIFTAEATNTHYMATIKHLVAVTPKVWKVEQYNPRKTIELPRDIWTHARRVVGKYNE